MFFGFEAVLGDEAEGLKVHPLAFREALVWHLVEGGFTHPSETWWLYDRVRSVAVHGGEPPPVERPTAESMAWRLRITLNCVLAIAADQQLTRRVQLRRFLDKHPDGAQLVDWLRTNAGADWDSFLAARSPAPGGTTPSNGQGL
ncbi:MAG TPA: hypothetical protein VH371_00420 [Candidatus Limnocylindrales bacterium]